MFINGTPHAVTDLWDVGAHRLNRKFTPAFAAAIRRCSMQRQSGGASKRRAGTHT